ncbi:LacI family DNA-binding transcriptional regulator [Deinococcus sp. QL22]|uniref:LacI family DNA-binding transcriptional regulator n=1 Tax=Deinococcus sp. QL22 TaxID=2939437 RepID=UPI002016BBF3|nr:LacI family DNA-binding transcriptional regulator [Deinococcus sp. QL22]UQN09036.1 LacI family transcriptional regulator [Deinococcus sp. QL22]
MSEGGITAVPTTAPRGAGIREVARQAGVSTATVSRVFNNAESVNPETRQRVMELAASLNYSPSPLGRNLVQGRSSLIGLLVPNLSFPLYGEMIRAVEDVLSAHGMSALLASSHDDAATETRAAHNLLRHAVDGGIVINSQAGFSLPTVRGMNWVQVAPELPNLPHRVELDNEEGGRVAARELLRCGRRDLAYVGAEGRESADRERGFAAELAQVSLSYRRFVGDYSEASGLVAAGSLLDQGDPLDGIFAAGDLMAAGVLRTLHLRGLRVPADMAVVGFDDAVIASLLYPRLTSIRQPADLMGQAAAELVLSLLSGILRPPQIFAPTLVRRESTGPPD